MKGFYWACFYGSKDIAKLILDFSQENDSIDLNASDYKGSNAFQFSYGLIECMAKPKLLN